MEEWGLTDKERQGIDLLELAMKWCREDGIKVGIPDGGREGKRMGYVVAVLSLDSLTVCRLESGEIVAVMKESGEKGTIKT